MNDTENIEAFSPDTETLCKICAKRKKHGVPYTIKNFLDYYALIYGTPEADFIPTACESCILELKHYLNIDQSEITKIELEFKCSKCKERFLNKTFLLQHKEGNICEGVACLVCFSKFNNEDNLNVHRLEHARELLYKCPACSSFIRNHDKIKEIHNEKYCPFTVMAKPKLEIVEPIENIKYLETESSLDDSEVSYLVQTDLKHEELILKDENSSNIDIEPVHRNKRAKTIRSGSHTVPVPSESSTSLVFIQHPISIPVDNINPVTVPLHFREIRPKPAPVISTVTHNTRGNTKNKLPNKPLNTNNKTVKMGNHSSSQVNKDLVQNKTKSGANKRPHPEENKPTRHREKNPNRRQNQDLINYLPTMCREMNRDPKHKLNKIVQTNSLEIVQTSKLEFKGTIKNFTTKPHPDLKMYKLIEQLDKERYQSAVQCKMEHNLDRDKLELTVLFKKSELPSSDVAIMHDMETQT